MSGSQGDSYDIRISSSKDINIGSDSTESWVTYWAGRPASLDELFIGREADLDGIKTDVSGKQAAVISGIAACG